MANDRVVPLALKHLALLASLGVIALAVMRVYFFSGFSVPVGLAVLGVADRAAVLASTLLLVGIAFLPLLIVYGPARTWLLAGNELGSPVAVKFRTALIWVPLSAFILSSTPLSVLLALLGGTITGLVLRRILLKVRDGSDQGPTRVRSVAGAINWFWATATGVLLTLILQQSWMPVERIELSDSHEDFVGYVVGEQSGSTLLLDRDKLPKWVPTEQLGAREVCEPSPGSWTSRSAVELLRSLSIDRLPACPPRP